MLLAGLASAQPALHLKALKQAPARRARGFDAPPKTRTPGRSHGLIQFAGSPSDDQLRELAKRGVAVLSYVPDFALSISAADDVSFEGLGIQWAGRLKPHEKISPELAATLISGKPLEAVIEFYTDVDPSDAREIANTEGLVIQQNPDLLANHLLVQGDGKQLLKLVEWDEVSYIFPASQDLIRGTPVRGCSGGLTKQGPVAQIVALVNQGWGSHYGHRGCSIRV